MNNYKTLEELIIKYDKKVMKLEQENKQLKEDKRKVRDYINKHCVNEKVSKEVGFKVYTMAVTDELEKIMKILGDDENEWRRTFWIFKNTSFNNRGL